MATANTNQIVVSTLLTATPALITAGATVADTENSAN
jgi:hypothetical protein